MAPMKDDGSAKRVKALLTAPKVVHLHIQCRSCCPGNPAKGDGCWSFGRHSGGGWPSSSERCLSCNMFLTGCYARQAAGHGEEAASYGRSRGICNLYATVMAWGVSTLADLMNRCTTQDREKELIRMIRSMSSSSSAARPNLAACGSSCQEGCSCLGVKRSVVACWARLLLPRQLSALLLLHPVRSPQLLHHARPLLLLHRLRPLLLLHRLRPLLLLHRRRPCRLHLLRLRHPCIDVRGQSKSTPTCMPGHAAKVGRCPGIGYVGQG